MTQHQALARYGEPKTLSITDKGEVWVYLLNYGEVLGKAFIPFNFKVTPVRTGARTGESVRLPRDRDSVVYEVEPESFKSVIR